MFYSVHRPKTGGTSIQYAFTNAYGNEKTLLLGHSTTQPSNKQLLKLCLSSNSEELFELMEIIIYVGGHMNDSKLLWYKRNFNNLNTVLVIREPISLFWSSYYQFLYGKPNRSKFTPENFLEKRKDLIQWYTNKYASVFGTESLDPTSRNFLHFFKYIIPTEKISDSVPLIYEKTREWLEVPRRQMSNDSKKIKHELHGNANFTSFLRDKLAKDYSFFENAQKLYNESNYENKNYSDNSTTNALNNFHANKAPSDYTNQLRSLVASNIEKLEKRLSSDQEKAKKIKRQLKEWDSALGDFGHSIKTFKKLFPNTSRKKLYPQ